jgi:hypothetical protein
MAQEIICEYCGHKIQVTNPRELPKDCPNCNSPLENIHIQEATCSEQSTGLDGLTFTSLETRKDVRFNHADEIVVGREALRPSAIANIEFISGKHCRIEVVDNQYCVTDLGSRNGTFVGTGRIDCGRNPRQVLHDGDILTLGREAFRVKIHCATTAESVEIAADAIVPDQQVETAPPELTRHECQNCHGYVSDEKEFVCPKCGTFND